MKMPKWPWWGWLIAGVVFLGVLSALFNPDAQQAESVKPQKVNLREVEVLVGGRSQPLRTLAVTIPAGSGAQLTEDAARQLCEGASHCSVLGFPVGGAKSTAMPMTEREAAELVYSYSLNRSSGMDESLWNCRVFADAPPARCMSAE